MRAVYYLLTLFALPESPIGVLVLSQSLLSILDAVPRFQRRDEMPIFGLDGVRQDLTEGINVLQEALLARNTEVVDQG